MNRPVKLYDLAPSPNSIKVRLALAFKKIAYEKIRVEPQNREPIIKASGQPLAPVLLHGDTVVYDSYAITRYLDANWPGPPRLYSADRDTIKKIEAWELFARTDAGPSISIMFAQLRAPVVDDDRVLKANESINMAAARAEETLAKSPYLMGEVPNAADFALASMLCLGVVPEEAAQSDRVAAFFRARLTIQGAPKTRAWIARIMEWDR